MKALIFTLLMLPTLASAKGTGNYFTKLDTRLVDNKYCVLTGTYNDINFNNRPTRKAFLTDNEFCKSETIASLLSYANNQGVEVFFSSIRNPEDVVRENTAVYRAIYKKIDISDIEKRSAIDLTAELQDAVSKRAGN